MQDLETAVETQIAAEQSRPILLFELNLDSGTLRYAATNADVVFPAGGGGNTYYAKAIAMGNTKSSAEGQLESASFQFDNVLGDMHAYNVSESFDGKEIIVKKVYRDAMGNSLYYRQVFKGVMEEPEVPDRQWFMVNAVRDGIRFNRRVLQKYFQKECNNVFGDSNCNYDGYANLASLTASGTADSGATTYFIDNALTQAADYWKFGRVEITVSGTLYKRLIESFDAATDKITFDVPLPVSVAAGSAYTIYKGCPLTRAACGASEDYGPSADNTANFAGWKDIGDRIDD